MTIPKQRVFDRAVAQLRTMNGRAGGIDALDGKFRCLYRSPKGPCLAGSFIPDDAYDAQWEGTSASDLPGDMLPDLDAESIQLLSDLQDAHDGEHNWNGPVFTNWRHIRDLGFSYGLDLSKA